MCWGGVGLILMDMVSGSCPDVISVYSCGVRITIWKLISALFKTKGRLGV